MLYKQIVKVFKDVRPQTPLIDAKMAGERIVAITAGEMWLWWPTTGDDWVYQPQLEHSELLTCVGGDDNICVLGTSHGRLFYLYNRDQNGIPRWRSTLKYEDLQNVCVAHGYVASHHSRVSISVYKAKENELVPVRAELLPSDSKFGDLRIIKQNLFGKPYLIVPAWLPKDRYDLRIYLWPLKNRDGEMETTVPLGHRIRTILHVERHGHILLEIDGGDRLVVDGFTGDFMGGPFSHDTKQTRQGRGCLFNSGKVLIEYHTSSKYPDVSAAEFDPVEEVWHALGVAKIRSYDESEDEFFFQNMDSGPLGILLLPTKKYLHRRNFAEAEQANPDVKKTSAKEFENEVMLLRWRESASPDDEWELFCDRRTHSLPGLDVEFRYDQGEIIEWD